MIKDIYIINKNKQIKKIMIIIRRRRRSKKVMEH